MLTLFNSGWVGSLIGLGGLIVGVVSFVSYLRNSIGGRLHYVCRSFYLLGSHKQELPSEVTVLFKGQTVPRVTLTKIYLWNSGKKTINGEHIVSDDPVRYCFHDRDRELGERILKVDVAKVTREVNKVSADIFGAKNEQVKIDFDFLDAGDGARVDVLHTFEPRAPTFAGTIRGLPRGARAVGARSERYFWWISRRIRKPGHAPLVIVCLLSGLIGLLFIVSSFLPSSMFIAMWRKPEPASIEGGRIVCFVAGLAYAFLAVLPLLYSRRRYPSALDDVS